MKEMKRFAVFLSILLVISNLSFLQPQAIHAAGLDNAVTISAIDENGEIALPMTAVSINEGDTAFDVLERAGQKHNKEIDYEVFGFGNMITGIGGVYPEDDFYWSFNVYGTGQNIGASSYAVSNGDNILLVLTDYPPAMVDVTVSAIDKDRTDVIPATEVSLSKGATAYDALYQAAKQNNILIDVTVDDAYFTFLNNINNTDLGDTDYWSFELNGQSSMVGLVGEQIKSGDHIKLSVVSWAGEDSDPAEDEDKGESTEPQEEPDDDKKETEIPDSSEPKITTKLIQNNINNLTNYISDKNLAAAYGDEWWIFGLANTDKKVPNSYVKSAKEKVKEVDGEFRNIYDLERMIIALSATGTDATSVEGHDLIEKLINHRHLESPIINAAIYGLLALDSGQYDVDNAVRNKLIKAILDNEISGGGWAFSGKKPSADITGMALTALAPYQGQAKVKAAIDRAVNYLSVAQDNTGGYASEVNGGDPSESVSQVITGLASVGIDPTGSKFTKSGGNLIQHLMKFKNENGTFSHLLNENSSDQMATSQALIALTAYQKLNTGKLVYQFTLKYEQEKPKEPAKPTKPKPVEKKPMQSKKKEVIVKPATKIDSIKQKMTTKVKAKDLQDIKDNGIIIIQPDQAKKQIVLDVELSNSEINKLVEKNNKLQINKGDTSLQIPVDILIQLVREANNEPVNIQLVKQEVEGALGAVYDFIMTVGSREISSLDGEVTFTLEVDPDLVKDIDPNKVKAFYFNKETGEWEMIADSTYDASKGIVTAKTNHFSVFGVFEHDDNVIDEIPTKAKAANVDKNGNELPNTATNMYNLISVGLILLIGGVGILTIRRKTRSNE